MLCPHCRTNINDPVPECPTCGFHIRDLDAELGPPPTYPGLLLDEAGLLDPNEHQSLLDRLEVFNTKTRCQLVVVTRVTTAPRLPTEYVFWLFNRWKVGGEKHRGLLILLARDERRIEVEVGYGLEQIITDQVSQSILDAHCVPFLQAERFAEALTWAADVLANVIGNAPGMARE